MLEVHGTHFLTSTNQLYYMVIILLFNLTRKEINCPTSTSVMIVQCGQNLYFNRLDYIYIQITFRDIKFSSMLLHFEPKKQFQDIV